MTQKFSRMSPRRQKKHINHMTRKMLYLALLKAGCDPGQMRLKTKRDDIKFVTAMIVGNNYVVLSKSIKLTRRFNEGAFGASASGLNPSPRL